MIEARTYLGDDRGLIPLERFEGKIRDRDYVEGAIDLTIDGQPIITVEEWDLVDQLWAYLVNGAIEVAEGASFETYFPDQPLRLRFTVEGEMVTLAIHTHEPRSVTLSRRDFVAGIAAAAAPVFTRLLALIPENRDGYQHVLGQIETLRAYLQVE